MPRHHSNPQCPVPRWERYGRLYGYERPKCVCVDAEPEPDPDPLELPFEGPSPIEPPPRPTEDLAWCTNCGGTDGFHRDWCYRWRGG